jgi:hypothetical protein
MDPSVYRAGTLFVPKPTDGSGDLTFTRSSGATRVGPNGYIEKVRTNLILQSQTFDNTSWTGLAANVSVTGNVIVDPFGGNDADIIVANAITSNIIYVRQGFTLPSTGTYTFSVYVKKQNQDTVGLRSIATGLLINYDLVNETSSNPAGFIEDAGNGWFRIGLTYTSATTTESIYIYPLGTGTRTGNGVDGVYVFGAQLEVSDIATDYIPTTTTAVSVGPVANIPRLDYFSDNCPKLLLEPQRTNLAQYSEQFNNAYWGKLNSSISANQILSPSGYQDADLIIEDTANSFHNLGTSGIASVAGVYTGSAFFKKNTKNFGFIQIATNGVTNRYTAVVDLVNGTITSTDSVGSPTSTSNAIVDYGNGWYRVSVSSQHNSGSLYLVIGLSNSGTPTFNASGYPTYTGNGTDSIAMWGAQVEAGAYATSYIPTLGSAVTRNADAAFKTGASSFIGQTEGTIFVEFVHDISVTALFDSRIQLSDGTTGQWIFMGLPDGATKLLRMYIASVSGNLSFYSNTGVVQGLNKAAFAYKSGDFAAYLNGTQVATNTTAHAIPPCSRINLQGGSPPSPTQERENIKQALLFKTRLSNPDLARLTSI